MSAFGVTIAKWTAFYALAGGASATLVGLLFVAVSLHIDIVVDERFPDAKALAQQAFYTFLFIIVVALDFLVPEQSLRGVGLTMFFIALVGMLQELRIVRETMSDVRRIKQNTQRAIFLLRRVFTPLVCYFTMLVCALAILDGLTDALYYLVGAVIVLMSNATGNSWNLLLRLAQVKRTMANTRRESLTRRGDDLPQDDDANS